MHTYISFKTTVNCCLPLSHLLTKISDTLHLTLLCSCEADGNLVCRCGKVRMMNTDQLSKWTIWRKWNFLPTGLACCGATAVESSSCKRLKLQMWFSALRWCEQETLHHWRRRRQCLKAAFSVLLMCSLLIYDGHQKLIASLWSVRVIDVIMLTLNMPHIGVTWYSFPIDYSRDNYGFA